MNEGEFEGLGLTANEIKVYLCIAQAGQITPTEIAKQTQLHRPNVYDALTRLSSRGLINQSLYNETKFYEIDNPDALIDILRQREKKIRELIPQLLLGRQIMTSKSTVRIHEGVFAFRNILRKFLEINHDIYAYGIPKDIVKWIGEGFINEFHQTRAQQKMNMLHIYDTDARERVKYLNTLPYTKAGYLPNMVESKTMTMTCSPIVVITIFSVKPELIIEIENAELSASYKKYFEIMYEICKTE